MLVNEIERIGYFQDTLLASLTRVNHDEINFRRSLPNWVLPKGHGLSIYDTFYMTLQPLSDEDRQLVGVMNEARREYGVPVEGATVTLFEYLSAFATCAAEYFGGTEALWLEILIENTTLNRLHANYNQLGATLYKINAGEYPLFHVFNTESHVKSFQLLVKKIERSYDSSHICFDMEKLKRFIRFGELMSH